MKVKNYKIDKLLRKYEKELEKCLGKDEVKEIQYYGADKIEVSFYPAYSHFFKKGIFDWSFGSTNYVDKHRFLIHLN